MPITEAKVTFDSGNKFSHAVIGVGVTPDFATRYTTRGAMEFINQRLRGLGLTCEELSSKKECDGPAVKTAGDYKYWCSQLTIFNEKNRVGVLDIVGFDD